VTGIRVSISKTHIPKLSAAVQSVGECRLTLLGRTPCLQPILLCRSRATCWHLSSMPSHVSRHSSLEAPRLVAHAAEVHTIRLEWQSTSM
jgi:hypothetical protein